MVTRDIKMVDGGEKRIKSRMNIPVLYITRPRPEKIKEILQKRIEYCSRLIGTKEMQQPPPQHLTSQQLIQHYAQQQALQVKREQCCAKLKRALDQKEIDRLMSQHFEDKIKPITYYLKLMQLVLAIGIESEEKWELLSQKDVNSIVFEGLDTYQVYIVDHRNMAKSFFKSTSFFIQSATFPK
jgi:hypothetical protein